MAAQATDILSLAEAKAQLLVDFDDDDQRITLAISSAVAHAVRRTGIPLLDTTEIVQFNPRPELTLVYISARGVTAVTSIKYHTPAQKHGEEPAGEIDLEEAPARILNNQVIISRPGSKWPDTLRGSLYEITMEFKTPAAAIDDDIKQAIILLTRAFYEGHPLPGTHPANALLDSINPYYGVL